MKTKNQTSLVLSILAAFVLIFSSCKKQTASESLEFTHQQPVHPLKMYK